MALPKLQFNLFLSNPNSASSLPENPFTVQCRQAAVLPPFTEKWSVDSWRTKKTLQLPKYQKQTKDIEEFPPLITPGEARSLHDKLGDAAFGKAFLLQGGGDCAAESSKEFNGDRIRETFNILLQMATVLILGETCTCDAQVSDRMDPNELVKLIDILNPANLPGRITIISRMGSERLESQASGIDQCCAWVKANRDMGLRAHAWKRQSAMWSCGLKSARPFDHVLAEVGAFFYVHGQEGSHPGGIHLEITGGQNVTEWTGGSCTETSYDFSSRYRTHQYDPRLNASQSLELAFIVAERLKHRRCRGCSHQHSN